MKWNKTNENDRKYQKNIFTWSLWHMSALSNSSSESEIVPFAFLMQNFTELNLFLKNVLFWFGFLFNHIP